MKSLCFNVEGTGATRERELESQNERKGNTLGKKKKKKSLICVSPHINFGPLFYS